MQFAGDSSSPLASR